MTDGERPEAEAYRAGLRCNGKWRGRKHSIYEGGFRVPFLARWPGYVPAGTVCEETVNLVDTYATIAAVIDRPVPADEEVAEDSVSFLPALLGESPPKPLRSSMILHSPNGNFAIRQGPWKYIEGKACPTLKKTSRKDELVAQLYNLRDDPGEQNNVLSEHPEIANQLAELLNDERSASTERSNRKGVPSRSRHTTRRAYSTSRTSASGACPDGTVQRPFTGEHRCTD
jgi:arylsulfatase A-like enzyme